VNRSDSIAALAEAFVAFQAEVKNPVKSGKVDTGKFSYTFAPLPEILEAVRPLLSKNGLAVTQELVSDTTGGVGAATLIMHKSGEWIAFSPLFVPAGEDAREHGSAASYARRYALLAALNLSTADDEAAGAAPPARRTPRRAGGGGTVMVTDRQKSKIAAEADALGITDEQLAKALQRDFKVETTGELTRDQASELIARLMKRREEADEEPPGKSTLRGEVDPDYEAARADVGGDGHIF
jgi:hypothetical protein